MTIHSRSFTRQDSSAIRWIEYNMRTREMLVEMHKGDCFTIAEVRYSEFMGIVEADSIGRAWNAFRMQPGIIIDRA